MQPFSNPWKQKNSTVFWCFQGVEKKCIGNKWVSSWKIVLIYFCYIIWSRQKVFKSCKFSPNTVRWLEVLCTFNSRPMSSGFDLIAFVCNVKLVVIVFLFVSFSFLALFLDGLANFFSSVFIRYPGYVSPWSNLITWHTMSFHALCFKNNGGFKWAWESCSWNSKIIKSPLPQYLWSPNLAGGWLTFKGSHP